MENEYVIRLKNILLGLDFKEIEIPPLSLQKCSYSICNRIPYFGYLPNKPLVCSSHNTQKLKNVIICHKCKTRASYWKPYTTSPLYCDKHKEIGYINILNDNVVITIKDLLENPNNNWNWFALTIYNKYIKVKDINSNRQFPWFLYDISYKENITMREVLENPELPWSWNLLSYNASITIVDVLQHPKYPWSIGILNKSTKPYFDLINDRILILFVLNNTKSIVINIPKPIINEISKF